MRPSLLCRRQVLAGGAAMLAAPAIAQARMRVRLGYLHVVAVDGQILTGLDRGTFDKQGIDFELVARDTGPEVFEALASGEVDMLSAGGVISNYLAFGAGRGFLINDIEIATAQLWVRPDHGVRTIADLRGRRIATTTRTTAHIFLYRALRANGLHFADVQVVNSSMPQAVSAFIAGEVPAVALWVPFNLNVRDRLPEALKLADASAFYPQSAVVGGWVTGHQYHAANREVLQRVIRGWAEANDYMVRHPKAAAEALQQRHYQRASIADMAEILAAQKMFSSREWKRLYADGSVVRWLQQVSDFFVAEAAAASSVPAKDYFDADLYRTTLN